MLHGWAWSLSQATFLRATWHNDFRPLSLSYFITWPPVCMRSIVVGMSVCLSVSLFVFLSAGAFQHTSKFHQIFWTCWYLWAWLGSPPTTVRWVMYFRFCGWRHVLYNGGNGPNQRRRLRFVQFARWRYRGRSLPPPTTFCFVVWHHTLVW